MHRVFWVAVLATCSAVAFQHAAHAHAIAGARVFPVTLTIDDPGVSDEASLPSFTATRQGASGSAGPGWEYDLGFEFDKTITKDFALGISDDYVIQALHGQKTQTGFLNINVSGKYQAWVNAEHETIVSLGVVREFGRTGTEHIGADQYGGTTPTGYFGKGMGDLPVPLLRPFAVTGEFAYTVADKKLKQIITPDTLATGIMEFNSGNENRWSGGLSLQYSLPYLRSQVKDYGLPEFVNRLVPLVELSWSSPASKPSALGTQVVFAPGAIYMADTYEVGLEALIPANRASGRNVGVAALFHVFFDDLFPTSLGKPLIND